MKFHWRVQRFLHARAKGKLRAELAARPRPPRAVSTLDGLASGRLLVVIAHPDDEVIAAGALMAGAGSVGVICATNGAPVDGSAAEAAGFDNWMAYAQARVAESDAALKQLGREIRLAENLGIPDQALSSHLVPLARYLVARLRDGVSHVITHAYEGGHPDHDSTAFAVHAACALIAQSGAEPPIIVEAPLYNAPGEDWTYGRFVDHPDAGPELVMPLGSKQQALKRRLFECHATQSDVLARFSLTEERFRVAPRYHFAVAPHPGEVGFSRWPWLIGGPVWRDHASRAMERLGLVETLA